MYSKLKIHSRVFGGHLETGGLDKWNIQSAGRNRHMGYLGILVSCPPVIKVESLRSRSPVVAYASAGCVPSLIHIRRSPHLRSVIFVCFLETLENLSIFYPFRDQVPLLHHSI